MGPTGTGPPLAPTLGRDSKMRCLLPSIVPLHRYCPGDFLPPVTPGNALRILVLLVLRGSSRFLLLDHALPTAAEPPFPAGAILFWVLRSCCKVTLVQVVYLLCVS